jgi:hypothetical protein
MDLLSGSPMKPSDVIPALDAGIHGNGTMDRRVKPGDDKLIWSGARALTGNR